MLKEKTLPKINMYDQPLYTRYSEYINLQQWDIVMVDFGDNVGSEKNGVRPAVIVSKENINRSSGNVIVAPITKAMNKYDDCGRLRLYSSQVFLSDNFFTGLTYPSIVQYEDIRSISRNRIISNIDYLSELKIYESQKAIKSILA